MGGLSSARNFALPYTDDCPLVTFVDSDDWLEPGIYQSAVSYLQQHPEVSILGYGHNKVAGHLLLALPYARDDFVARGGFR